MAYLPIMTLFTEVDQHHNIRIGFGEVDRTEETSDARGIVQEFTRDVHVLL